MSTITDHSRLGPDPGLGLTLREVRRRQGLSRSHVAHSAGLTRRELAAYERGRVAVPETDLSSLAGSCGVEVDELTGQHSLAIPEPPRQRSYPENPFAVLRDVDDAHSSAPDPAITEAADLAEIKWLADGTLPARPPLGDVQRVDAEWHTGGIFPRTVIDDEVSLQHADTEWALVDACAPDDVRVEAVVDFSAGVGFGVLFRASLDDAARISAYAFEVDPAPGSGGYLLRAWSDDRQHWCPLSRAIVTEPARMFGHHTIEVQVVGDRVTAGVDGDEVLVIPSLIGTTSRLGLEPCTGSSVGVLSRATTEITVATFRVAHA